MSRSDQNYTDLIADARVWPRDGVSKGPLINALADAIEALVKERDQAIRDLDAGFAESDHLSAKYYQRMRAAEREMHARELDHFEEEQKSAGLAAVIDKVRGVIGAEIGWESPAVLIDRIQWALSAAPADALAEHDAALIESLADAWSEWETFTASDGHKSIRQHGLSPDDWLRSRAQQIREGGNR